MNSLRWHFLTVGILLTAGPAHLSAQIPPSHIQLYTAYATSSTLNRYPGHLGLASGVTYGIDVSTRVRGRFGVVLGASTTSRKSSGECCSYDDAEAFMARTGVVFYPQRSKGLEVYAGPALMVVDFEDDEPLSNFAVAFGGNYSRPIVSALAVTASVEFARVYWNSGELKSRDVDQVNDDLQYLYKVPSSMLTSLRVGLQWKPSTRFAWELKEHKVLPGSTPEALMAEVRAVLFKVAAVQRSHFEEHGTYVKDKGTLQTLVPELAEDVSIATEVYAQGWTASAARLGFAKSTCVYWTGEVPLMKRPHTKKDKFIAKVPDRIVCDWDNFRN